MPNGTSVIAFSRSLSECAGAVLQVRRLRPTKLGSLGFMDACHFDIASVQSSRRVAPIAAIILQDDELPQLVLHCITFVILAPSLPSLHSSSHLVNMYLLPKFFLADPVRLRFAFRMSFCLPA
jgi:hypothetical protein